MDLIAEIIERELDHESQQRSDRWKLAELLAGANKDERLRLELKLAPILGRRQCRRLRRAWQFWREEARIDLRRLKKYAPSELGEFAAVGIRKSEADKIMRRLENGDSRDAVLKLLRDRKA